MFTSDTYDYRAELDAAVEAWDARGWPRPGIVLVSGSGLAVDLGEPTHGPVPLAELMPFPIHAIEGHPHTVEILAPLPDRPVLYYRGRLHSYQGYSAHEVAFPIRLGRLLGARVLILTNATGGLNPALRPGDLLAIRDQINLSGLNPLRGDLPASWGPRFPDMGEAYDQSLRERAQETGRSLAILIGEGTYLGVSGPCYETPAEVRAYHQLGGDVTGMSTVLEIIAARHMGLRCLGLSLVSNAAAGLTDGPVDHHEVLAAGKAAAAKLHRLLEALLEDSGLEG
ncbi:MAG TPA: purine-nucleoside phosphorylase [Thermoanaerobaculia bacterium]|jgi:purine-nucleoside phosphorylase|nr:purine-nucleoside phosphorylase [Thermoanaerobaculia bacterium]